MRKFLKYFIIIVLVSLNNLSFAQSNLKEVTLAVHWLPQAQFAGYYIGLEKGIYKKHGFDVKLLHSSPNITAQELLLDGKADFATMFLTTAIMLKSNNAPIVNVGQLSQKCGQVLVAKKNNINDVSDLKGKKVGVWRSGFDEILMSFSDKYELNIELVLISSTINLFLFGGIDAMTTMWFNEYHSIINAGFDKDELTTFFFADYGFDIPEDGIYMLENRFDKETSKKFVAATLEAWEYTFANKDEAIELVKKEMKEKFIPFNKPHQYWMLNRIHDLFNIKEKKYKPGQLLESDFETAYEVLSQHNRIRNGFTFENFYFGIK